MFKLKYKKEAVMGLIRTALWGVFWYSVIGWLTKARFGRCLLFGLLCGFLYSLFSGGFIKYFHGVSYYEGQILIAHFWIVAAGACLISYVLVLSLSIRVRREQAEAERLAEIERNRPRRMGYAVKRDEDGKIIFPSDFSYCDLDEYEAKYGKGSAMKDI